MDCLLDGPTGSRETFLIDRELRAAGIDRVSQALNREIREFFGDPFESCSYLFEFACHSADRIG